MNKSTFTAFTIALFVCLPSAGFSAQCEDHFSDHQLLSLKRHNFDIESADKRNSTALKLMTCIGHSNPAIRDGVVYEASNYWLRKQLLTTNTTIAMFEVLTNILANQNSNGTVQDSSNFKQPFAALVLSEVVRVDRISPYLNTKQRQQIVDASSHYMQQISDYRGFDDDEGWRHSVAHTADIFLQLALNQNISKSQLTKLLSAIKSQVNPLNHHFYVYGEPKRLVMAFVYIAIRSEFSDQELQSYLDSIANPEPFSSWRDVYSSNEGLAKLHNTRAFIYSALAITSQSENPKLIALQNKLIELIKSLG